MSILFAKQLPSQSNYTLTYSCEEDFDFSQNLEIQHELEDGNMVAFGAKITASLAGIDLGSDAIWSCVEEDYEKFLGSGYIEDMIKTAIEAADKMLDEMINQRRQGMNRFDRDHPLGTKTDWNIG